MRASVYTTPPMARLAVVKRRLEWFWHFFDAAYVAQLREEKSAADTRAEMQAHLEMMVEDGVRRGLTRAEAEHAARLHAGTIASALESVRDERGLGPLDGTVGDLRHAWTALRRQKSFLIIACTALALAVALNTLIIALVDGVLLRPLPYRDSGRLAMIWSVVVFVPPSQSMLTPLLSVTVTLVRASSPVFAIRYFQVTGWLTSIYGPGALLESTLLVVLVIETLGAGPTAISVKKASWEPFNVR